MAKVVGDITVSLDGFVTGPDAGPTNGLGTGGDGLHEWVFASDPVDAAVLADSTAATGAVIMGRKLFDVVDAPGGWSDEMGYGAHHAATPPVFVVTRQPPDSPRLGERFTFVVDGLATAVATGVTVAGDRAVVVMGGGRTIRSALAEGLLDELRLHLAPVVLGAGTPLFDGNPPVRLRQTHVRVSANATHLTYRVT